jgi:hypothetical protein
MRTFPFLLVLLLSACGRAEREREAAVEAARAATVVQIERMLSQTIRRADRLAGSANRILAPLPVMTPAEEGALRRFQNAAHVARARALGVRVGNQAATDSLLSSGLLVQLEDSTQHWIVRRGSSPAHVVPHLRALLEVLAGRFQERLAGLGLPPYRIEVTSALRTSERQAELRQSNANAAAVPTELAPHLERIVDLALESVSARKSRELGAIFSRVLREAQAEGLALVLYERQQTVYHLTVARALAEP